MKKKKRKKKKTKAELHAILWKKAQSKAVKRVERAYTNAKKQVVTKMKKVVTRAKTL